MGAVLIGLSWCAAVLFLTIIVLGEYLAAKEEDRWKW